MADFLFHIDIQVFYFINHTLSNPVFDKFFTFITEVKHWFLLYIVLFFMIILKGGRRGKIAAIGLILLIIITDQFSSFFLKNLIARIRPCNELPDVNVLVGCTSSFSFPSSHAVNNFGVAVYFGKIFPRYKSLLISIASIVALSRPYVGVHYPSDIICGALIGGLIGYLFSLLVILLDTKVANKIDFPKRFKRIK